MELRLSKCARFDTPHVPLQTLVGGTRRSGGSQLVDAREVIAVVSEIAEPALKL